MPYVIAAAVIAFISRQYSLRSIWAEMAKGQALPLFPLALATYFASLAWVAAADRTVLRGLLPEELTPTYFAIAKGKAAAVVLHIVHYALGQGIYATWVARRTRLNVGQAGGLIFYIILGELGSVCLYAALVIGIGRPAVPGSVLPVVLGVALAVIAAVVLMPATRSERFGFLQIWVKVGRKRGLGLRLLVRSRERSGATHGPAGTGGGSLPRRALPRSVVLRAGRRQAPRPAPRSVAQPRRRARGEGLWLRTRRRGYGRLARDVAWHPRSR